MMNLFDILDHRTKNCQKEYPKPLEKVFARNNFKETVIYSYINDWHRKSRRKGKRMPRVR